MIDMTDFPNASQYPDIVPSDLNSLQTYLAANGVVVPSVGITSGKLHTYGSDGMPKLLPPEALPFVASYRPPPKPIVYSQGVPIKGVVHTDDATPKEIWRLALAALTGYAGRATVIGVDSGNGNVKVISVTFAVKRLNAAPASVGAPVAISTQQDAAATTWQVQPTFVGNNLIVNVVGALARPIDWSVVGEITSFAPAGIVGA